MLSNRRLLTCCATVLALVVCSSSALAKSPAHKTRFSRVAVNINAKRHILKLHVKHGAKRFATGAHSASAGGSATILVSFDHATVSGPNGAVGVGDDVTVTTSGPLGTTTVASSINVIGQPNGGDAGKGAALPGEVTAVDSTNGTLTLSVKSTDSQGNSQGSSVIVTVDATTILAVGDTNADGKITIADVVVGDHVVVFTKDATANPIAAVGILDASHAGGNHQGGGDGGHWNVTPIPGTVTAVDTIHSTLSLTVTDGSMSGQTITVDLSDHTSFGGEEDSNSNGPLGLSNIAVGDSVVAYTRDATTTPIVVVGIVDKTKSNSGGNGSSAPTYASFNGTVASVNGTSLQVTVGGDSPLAGQTVTVDASSARFKGATTDGSAFTVGDVAVGDQVRVYAHSLDPQPVVALFIGDGAPGSQGSGTPPTTPPTTSPTEPQRFGGIVTDVRGDGLTVNVTSGGPLSGQSVIVSVPSTASLSGATATPGGPESLANISVGDAVEIYTNSLTGSPVIARGVVDDSNSPSS